jgi:hypothetical protein
MDDAKLYCNAGIYCVGFNFEIPVVYWFWIFPGYFTLLVLDGLVGTDVCVPGNIGFESKKIN